MMREKGVVDSEHVGLHDGGMFNKDPVNPPFTVVGTRVYQCDACDCVLTESTVKKCSKCRMAVYCDARCQKLAWSTHKASCVPYDKASVFPAREKSVGPMPDSGFRVFNCKNGDLFVALSGELWTAADFLSVDPSITLVIPVHELIPVVKESGCGVVVKLSFGEILQIASPPVKRAQKLAQAHGNITRSIKRVPTWLHMMARGSVEAERRYNEFAGECMYYVGVLRLNNSINLWALADVEETAKSFIGWQIGRASCRERV